MGHFYIAGPLFTTQDRHQLERIEQALVTAGHTAFLPHRDGEDDSAKRGPEDEAADERRQRIFRADMEGLRKADGVVAMLDGADADAGTAFELGWAYANRRPIFGLRTDFRTLGPEGPVSLMLYASAERFLHAHDMPWEEVAAQIGEWADTVKPFGGRVVRDAVPKMLADKGQAMRFRKATEEERPVALKGKVRDAAEALAWADRGDEPDHLADLLEATEAFIRARRFDKSTLKAVKEGKWKSRGGYDEAWVTDAAVVDAARQSQE